MTVKQSDKIVCRANTPPFGWIQWKGTDVCVDLHCVCGHHGHMDTEFLYFWRCVKCKKVYALDPNIALIPVDDPDPKDGRVQEDRDDDL